MKALELRIGNTVDSWRIGGEWVPTQVQDGRVLDFIAQNEDIYRLITLTEEWLTKLRFVSRRTTPHIQYERPIDHTTILIIQLDGTNGWIAAIEELQYDKHNEGRVASVTIAHSRGLHRLQNLWFELTSTELNVSSRTPNTEE